MLVTRAARLPAARSSRSSSTSTVPSRWSTTRAAAPTQERGTKLREALALWRGPPLADFAFEAFAQPEIARLEELRLAALEERVEADLEAGAHAELVGELEALVAEHPLRERLRGQLMLALYRVGPAGGGAAGVPGRAAARSSTSSASSRARSSSSCTARSSGRRPGSSRPARRRRAEDHFAEVAAARSLAGRLVPVLGADVGELAARLAERFDYPPTSRPRAAARRAVRRA